MNLTYVKTDNKNVNKAYYTAVGDVIANIKPCSGGAMEGEKPVLIAGIGYEIPWTRDTAINVSNAGYLFPEIAKNTLLSVLKKENDEWVPDASYGQDWDSVIWAIGAWNYYVYTGDIEFLKRCYEISLSSWDYFEKRAYSEEMGLFRGPGCYGDGIAGYPDRYVKNNDSGILGYSDGKSGSTIEMYTVSTNCVYYEVLRTMDKMAAELGLEAQFEERAETLKKQINKLFWNEEKGYYTYILDSQGGCDYFEGIGNSFAILSGVADETKTKSIFANHPSDSCGIPCVYPSFERYNYDGNCGRHSGSIWPHIQSFWADAALLSGESHLFDKEFNMLTKCAVRDGHFAEIYHPVTSEIYGGLQENIGEGIRIWDSEKKQTWSATGYLHMIFFNIIGLKIDGDEISVSPYFPDGISEVEVTDLYIRGKRYNIKLKKGEQPCIECLGC